MEVSVLGHGEIYADRWCKVPEDIYEAVSTVHGPDRIVFWYVYFPLSVPVMSDKHFISSWFNSKGSSKFRGDEVKKVRPVTDVMDNVKSASAYSKGSTVFYVTTRENLGDSPTLVYLFTGEDIKECFPFLRLVKEQQRRPREEEPTSKMEEMMQKMVDDDPIEAFVDHYKYGERQTELDLPRPHDLDL